MSKILKISRKVAVFMIPLLCCIFLPPLFFGRHGKLKLIYMNYYIHRCNLGFIFISVYYYIFQAGLFIDKGVKTTNASGADPREYLCLDNSAR